MILEQLDAEAVNERLEQDPILTANEDLEAVLRPIVDSAADRGLPDLKVIIVDETPDGFTQLRDFANEVVDAGGGTVIVRAPGAVAASSDEVSRAALERGGWEMMQFYNDYPDGFNAFIDEVTSYTVPWMTGSLTVGLALVAVFAVLSVVWWRRSHP